MLTMSIMREEITRRHGMYGFGYISNYLPRNLLHESWGL